MNSIQVLAAACVLLTAVAASAQSSPAAGGAKPAPMPAHAASMPGGSAADVEFGVPLSLELRPDGGSPEIQVLSAAGDYDDDGLSNGAEASTHGTDPASEDTEGDGVYDGDESGTANLFVCPNMDAANIAFNITRAMTDGVVLGPILMGSAVPAHVLTPAATVRRVFNMTALACVEAQIRAQASLMPRE